jgi:hypothetical protein
MYVVRFQRFLHPSYSQIVELFNQIGEVKYVRLGHKTADPSSKLALVEFAEQPAVVAALRVASMPAELGGGIDFEGKRLTVAHSTLAIVKPRAKSNEAAQREIEEAMRRVKEAQQGMLGGNLDPGLYPCITIFFRTLGGCFCSWQTRCLSPGYLKSA